MSPTSQDLDAIDAALVQRATSGIDTVQFADRRITYRSAEDLLRLRDRLAQDAVTTPVGGRRPRQMRLVGSTGL